MQMCTVLVSHTFQAYKRDAVDTLWPETTSSMKVSDDDSGRKSEGCQRVFVSFRIGRTVFSMYGAIELTSSNCSLEIVWRICK